MRKSKKNRMGAVLMSIVLVAAVIGQAVAPPVYVSARPKAFNVAPDREMGEGTGEPLAVVPVSPTVDLSTLQAFRDPATKPSKLDSTLFELAALDSQQIDRFAGRHGLNLNQGRVQVQLSVEPGAQEVVRNATKSETSR